MYIGSSIILFVIEVYYTNKVALNLALYGACAIMFICECGEEKYFYWYLFSL